MSLHFAGYEDCKGPLMGHMKVKCPKLAYGDEDVKKFENYLKRIGGFKEAVQAREKKREEKRASEFVTLVKLALDSKVTPGVVQGGATQ